MAATAIETSVLAAVDATGVPYEAMPCDPEFADTAALCERYGVAPADTANTIVEPFAEDPGCAIRVRPPAWRPVPVDHVEQGPP